MVSPSAALSIAALAAGVTLMLLVHVLVIFWALRRDRDDTDAAEERGAENGSAGEAKVLTATELETLPCYDFDGSAGGGGDCAVCLEAFEAGDRCRRLPRCQHSFHAPCVDSWLQKCRCCPVCRADVVGGPGELKAVAEEGEMPRSLPLEMAERSGGSPVAVEVVSERMREYSRGSIPDGG